MHVSRTQAFGLHLATSAIVVSLFLALTFFILYPPPLFKVEGTLSAIEVLLAVDLVLGPLITLIVFKPGKPNLKFDMAVIVAIQLSAFVYGASVVINERPAIVSFAVDRFEVIPEADTSKMAMDKLDTGQIKLKTIGPTYVYAQRPRNPEKYDLVLGPFNGQPDLERRPEFYRDFRANIASSFDKAIDLKQYVEKFADARDKVEHFLKSTGKSYADIAAFPLAGKQHDMVLVVDKQSKELAGYIDINPWRG